MNYDNSILQHHNPGEQLRLWSLFNQEDLFYGKLQTYWSQVTTPLFAWASGNSQCGPEFIQRIPRNTSPLTSWGFGIELVTAGNAEVTCNGHVYSVGPGEVFLHHPGTDRTWATGSAGFLHKRFIMVAGTLLEPLLRETNLAGVTYVKPHNHGLIKSLFKKVDMLIGEQGPDHLEELSIAAYSVLIELGKLTKPTPLPAAVKLAIGLGFLFRTHTGVSPITFFLRMKIELAKLLLTDRSMSIKQVAEQLAYDNPYYFSRLFKSITGMSPRMFRMRLSSPVH